MYNILCYIMYRRAKQLFSIHIVDLNIKHLLMRCAYQQEQFCIIVHISNGNENVKLKYNNIIIYDQYNMHS